MSGPAKSQRLSWQPLGEYVEKWLTAKLGEPPNARQIAEFLEVDRSLIYAWRKRGVDEKHADQICQKILGVYAGQFWPDEYRQLDNQYLLDQVVEVLGWTYQPEGVEIWLGARNPRLGDRIPMDLIHAGEGQLVLNLATALADGIAT